MASTPAQKLVDTALGHHGAGELEQAERLYRQALDLEPGNHNALHLLGVLRQQQGALDAAAALIERAVATAPDFVEAHSNLGVVYEAMGRAEDAAAAYLRAIALDPGFATARFNLGNVRRDQGRLEDAAACYRLALEARPDHAQAHIGLADVLYDLGRMEEAVAAYKQGLALDPGQPGAQYNLGLALDRLGRLEDAAGFYRKAIEAHPDVAEAHVNLGNVLNAQGSSNEAVASYRRALALNPGLAQARGNLLLCLHYPSGVEPAALYAEHRAFNARHAAPLEGEIQPYANDRSPERALRIGYVSADFKQHSVAYFLEPVLAAHDRQRFTTYCYSGVAQPDAVTTRLQGYGDRWRSTVGLPDPALAQLIRDDRIDILVDLSGHTAGNRLLAMARKPAPVQVTWLGYPDTTGLDAMDYRITDGIADPPGSADALHSESLVRLAQGFLCYRPDPESPPVGELPAATVGRVTFASFNHLPKVTPEVIALWAEILRQTPGARLLLKSGLLAAQVTRQRYLALFAAHGIGPERLTLSGKIPQVAGHLDLYNQVDIALDPFPYNGTTTTCEALWMGVPVVTLAGNLHASRVGASLLTRVGLAELAVDTPQTYLEKAVALAGNLPQLARLRAGLRERMAGSPLCDAAGFTRALEQAYREMWKRWISVSAGG